MIRSAAHPIVVQSIERSSSEVLVAVVHRLELAAVNGDDSFRKQLQLAAQHDELAAHLADRGPIVLAKVGNGLEVRHQATVRRSSEHASARIALMSDASSELDVTSRMNDRSILMISIGKRLR